MLVIDKKRIIAGAGAIVIAVASYIYAITPHSYDDCILAGMEDAQNERAANLVAKACRSKFPERLTHASSPRVIKYAGPPYNGPNLFEEFTDPDAPAEKKSPL